MITLVESHFQGLHAEHDSLISMCMPCVRFASVFILTLNVFVLSVTCACSVCVLFLSLCVCSVNLYLCCSSWFLTLCMYLYIVFICEDVYAFLFVSLCLCLHLRSKMVPRNFLGPLPLYEFFSELVRGPALGRSGVSPS